MGGVPNFKKYPITGFPVHIVTWVDSHEPEGRNAEITRHDFPSSAEMVYVGMLVDETDTDIVLAEGYKPEDKVFDYVIAIPKVAIVSRRRLYLRSQPPETLSDGHA